MCDGKCIPRTTTAVFAATSVLQVRFVLVSVVVKVFELRGPVTIPPAQVRPIPPPGWGREEWEKKGVLEVLWGIVPNC